MSKKIKILIADDDRLVRVAVVKILEMFGYMVVACASGEEVLQELNDEFDAIVLDINMPGIDGFETMAAINKMGYGIPVLFLTGAGSMEYAVKAINLGAYDFITKPIEDLDLFNVKIQRAIEKRMYVLHERAYKNNLEQQVQEKTQELAEKNMLLEEYSNNLEVAAVSALASLQVALEEKDWYTAGHSTRVTEYARRIGKAMDIPDDELIVLQRACQVHDIGKLVIDNSCISKPGPLTDEEWIMVKKHPEIGDHIIKPLDFLSQERTVVRHHHERLDGKGYPDGLAGDEINLLTRIIIVADSYDAMTSKRSYKTNMSRSEAIEELKKCSGAQFDPDVVGVFIEILGQEDSAL